MNPKFCCSSYRFFSCNLSSIRSWFSWTFKSNWTSWGPNYCFSICVRYIDNCIVKTCFYICCCPFSLTIVCLNIPCLCIELLTIKLIVPLCIHDLLSLHPCPLSHAQECIILPLWTFPSDFTEDIKPKANALHLSVSDVFTVHDFQRYVGLRGSSGLEDPRVVSLLPTISISSFCDFYRSSVAFRIWWTNKSVCLSVYTPERPRATKL